MAAYRIAARITEGGQLVIRGVPFAEGEEVEVIVVPHRGDRRDPGVQGLRGKPVSLERPTEPVAENDWEALG